MIQNGDMIEFKVAPSAKDCDVRINDQSIGDKLSGFTITVDVSDATRFTLEGHGPDRQIIRGRIVTEELWQKWQEA